MSKKINILVIIGLILGILCGFLIPNIMNNISFIGTIYVNLLKFIIIPILLTNISISIYESKKQKTKLLFKTVLTFIVMFICTFLLTSLILSIINTNILEFNFNEIKWDGNIVDINIKDVIINLFPSNFSTMISNNSIFAVILFAFVFGLCASKVEHGDKVMEIMSGLKNIFNKILEYIMYLTPLAVFSLIGSTISTYGSSMIGTGLKYILLAFLCGILVMIFIMIIPVSIICKVSPITYIKKIYKVWIISMTTCSSLATLPTTIKTCNEELNIPSKITNIVVPLGCTINMCGSAVSFALLGIFCSQLFGIQIDATMFLTMLFSATIINMAAPGIPGGGIVLGATYLTILNIPLTFIGFYSGIYRLLDMNYTTLNVTGDITANMLINKFEKKNNFIHNKK